MIPGKISIEDLKQKWEKHMNFFPEEQSKYKVKTNTMSQVTVHDLVISFVFKSLNIKKNQKRILFMKEQNMPQYLVYDC